MIGVVARMRVCVCKDIGMPLFQVTTPDEIKSFARRPYRPVSKESVSEDPG